MVNGLTLGGAVVAASAILLGQYSADALPQRERGTRGGSEGGVASIGPDVIVGSLPNMQKFGTVNGITAYSVATTSCNIGDTILTWYQNTNQHPVIAQNLFRVRNGRIEQIGLGWLKHGFCALQQNLCGPCTPAGSGCPPLLGIGCSDPYSSDLNGQQSNLGPRSQVNASTGFFPYPFSASPAPATIGRRIQVANTDLQPSLNPGARWFVEGMYIHPDDSAAGNSANNASYREVTIGSFSSGGYNLTTTGPTYQQQPAIYGWKQVIPAVTIVPIDVPGDGRFLVGYLVTENGDGTFRYEYAIQNLTSDRSGGSLTMPRGSSAALSGIGFRHVNHHSGEPYSTNPWVISEQQDRVVWSTDASFQQNPNANALRWGTLYNFWFDSNVPPEPTTVSIGFFKTAGAVSFTGPAPMGEPPINADLDGNGVVDGADLGFLLSSWGDCPSNEACRADINRDGTVDGADLGLLLGAWG
jgi:hypothetical protein